MKVHFRLLFVLKKSEVHHKSNHTNTMLHAFSRLSIEALNTSRARSLVINDLRSEIKGSRFESGC